MQPYHPQQNQQPYYPPRQSRGFNPPPQQPPQQVRPPQQAPYPQAAQPGYVQQFQGHSQYQQQRPGLQYQQPQGYTPRYAPQAQAAPVAASLNHNRQYYASAPTQTHQAYVPFTPHTQPPVVSPPPVRASSRSPDKSGRPLPAPAATATAGARQPLQETSTGSVRSHVLPSQQPQILPYTHANPPASSFSGVPAASHSFPRGQQFQPQPPPQTHSTPPVQFQPQPQLPPHRPSLTKSHPGLPTSPPAADNTPPRSPVRTPDSPSKRPLPAPPGGSAVVSPPSTPSRSVVPAVGPSGVPVVDPPAASTAGPSLQRRALPFSPTKPPSVELARSSGRSPIRPPQRSSTLPSPLSPQDEAPFNRATSPGSKDDSGQSASHAGFVSDKSPAPTPSSQSTRTGGFVPPPSVQARSSAGFALPQQQRQKPTQSLAFRLASLSLQEEQTQKQPANHAPRASPSPSSVVSSRSPIRSMIDLDDAPPSSTIRRSSAESKPAPNIPPQLQSRILVTATNTQKADSHDDKGSEAPILVVDTPSVNVSKVPSIAVSQPPSISISEPPSVEATELPAINISEAPSISITEASPNDDSVEGPSITVSEATPKITVSDMPAMSTSSIPDIIVADLEGTLDTSVNNSPQKRKGLICYGCGNGILGRIVSAMGGRWHPACFKCTVCSELLEHVSSYEHAGKPYCHLDYHEKFAPQCYHCRTPIIDERFITLDDPALGKRMYHEQHFFCAECGDPFLAPTVPGKEKENETGVVAQDDDVGFTVYKGHPYCEACHVRLRYPKCKRCKKSIRDGMQAVEALGGKWCWECFLCAGCEKPFDNPAFFQRENKAYCEACFSVIIKSEL